MLEIRQTEVYSKWFNSLRDRQARARIEALGYAIEGVSDHTVSQSLYLSDPDGNEVELFVDNPAIDWRRDKSWMTAPVRPLRLPEE